MSGLGLTFLRRGGQAHPTAGSDYIKFADEAVFNILMSKGVSSDGIGITKDDAAKVTSIGTWFKGNTAIVSFDELRYFTGLTSIYGGSLTNDGAFYNCTSLTSVQIPESVTSLGKAAFRGCKALRQVGDLSHVTNILSYCFYQCSNLAINVEAGSLMGGVAYESWGDSGILRVLDLGSAKVLDAGSLNNEGAFNGCNNLDVAILPGSVTTIGKAAFGYCPNLISLICKATSVPTAGVNLLTNSSKATIYVPDASIADYQAATNWSTYASRIKGISSFATDNPLLYDEVKDYL